MKELSFIDVFTSKNKEDHYASSKWCDCAKKHYLTAIYAIEVLKTVEPAYVTENIGYMYAIENGKKLDLIKEDNWNAFVAKNYKQIEIDVIFKSLELISKLVEPFVKKDVDTSLAEFTVPLPKEIVRVILNEDLTDHNVMNTLELSLKHINLSAEDSLATNQENRNGFVQIAFEKVVEKFKPLLDKCNFSNSISEEKLRKDFNAITIHRYATWLSCLYRLFYHFDKNHWDTFEDIFKDPYGEYNHWINKETNVYISRALQVPVAEPETVVGITTVKKYKEPPLTKNRSSYLSLSERYLTLVYMQLD